jgi:hypothetical protein
MKHCEQHFYPVCWDANTHFNDIQFAVTTGHHTKTQDWYNSTLKSLLF